MKLLSVLSLKAKIIAGCVTAAAMTGAVVLAVNIANNADTYRLLKVFEMNGKSVVSRMDAGEIDAYTGMKLENRDIVEVGTESSMRLSLDEDKYLSLDPGTVLELVAEGTAEDSRTSLTLKSGGVLNEITEPLSASSVYEVNTPKATMAVRGTSFYVSVKMLDDGSYITDMTVFHGKVEVQLLDENGNPRGDPVMVNPNESIAILTVPDGSGVGAEINGTSSFILRKSDDPNTFALLAEGENPIMPMNCMIIPQSVLERVLSTHDNTNIILSEEVLRAILGGDVPAAEETSVTTEEKVQETTADETASETSAETTEETTASETTGGDSSATTVSASEIDDEEPVTTPVGTTASEPVTTTVPEKDDDTEVTTGKTTDDEIPEEDLEEISDFTTTGEVTTVSTPHRPIFFPSVTGPGTTTGTAPVTTPHYTTTAPSVTTPTTTTSEATTTTEAAPVLYTVRFVASFDNTVEVADPIEVEEGESITLPVFAATITVGGVSYTYWGVETTLAPVTADTTIVVNYVPTDSVYDVVVSDNGENVISGRYLEGESITLPAAKGGTGMRFSHWSLRGISSLGAVKERAQFGENAVVSISQANVYKYEEEHDTNIVLEAVYDYKVTVTFLGHDGTKLGTETGYKGDTIALPAAPERDGYTFDGWYLSDGTPFSGVIEGDTDFNVTAVYSITKYTVKFVASFDNTVEVADPIEVEEGGDITLPDFSETITVGGVSYTYWGVETALAPVTADTTIVVKYVPSDSIYDVTVSDNGETVISDRYLEGESITLPAAKGGTGIRFSHWGLMGASSGGTIKELRSYNAGDTVDVSEDNVYYYEAGNDRTIRVEAVYDNEVTVTFLGYDGTTVDTKTAYTGDTVTLPEGPDREGYTFDGWFKGDGTEFDGEIDEEADFTVTAKYTVISVAVTFNDHEGNAVATVTGDYGETITLPEEADREGYTFDGWFKGDGTEFDGKIDEEADFTVTAKYTIISVAVTFNDHEGNAVATVTGNYGETITLPDGPDREGYTFDGWFKGDGTEFDGKIDTVTGFTVTAKYTAVTVTVTFVDFYGEVVATETADYGETITLPDAEEIEYFTFDGWFKDDGTKFEGKIDEVTDFTVTADYTGVEVNVHFQDYKGNEYLVLVGNLDDTIELPEPPERKNYAFVRWVNQYDVEFTGYINMLGDIYVTAVYTPTANIVTFVSNPGGVVLDEQSIEDGGYAEVPAEFKDVYVSGTTYTFWEIEDDLGPISGDTEISVLYVDASTVFEVTVTDSGETVLSGRYRAGDTITLPDPAESGTFKYWGLLGANSGGVVKELDNYAPGETVTLDSTMRYFYENYNDPVVRIEAIYSHEITVTFLDYDGVTVLAEVTGMSGESITLPPNPTRDGYTFVNWQYVDGGRQFDGNIPSTTTANFSVKAKYN